MHCPSYTAMALRIDYIPRADRTSNQVPYIQTSTINLVIISARDEQFCFLLPKPIFGPRVKPTGLVSLSVTFL